MPTQAIDFSDQVALVCGAGAGGIGTATARMLAEGGAQVVAVDHTDALVDETRSMVTKLGGKCLGITVDLRDPSHSKSIVETDRQGNWQASSGREHCWWNTSRPVVAAGSYAR